MSVFLYEAALHDALPDYPSRLELVRCARRNAAKEARVCVFTDPAHSTFIWTWPEQTSLGIRHVEYRAPPRSGSLRRALRRLAGDAGTTNFLGLKPDPLQRELLERLGQRTLYAQDESFPADRLVDAIADLADVKALRRFWRRLLAIGVLHRRCGRGSWLVSTARLLEPLYLASLDRMRALVDDEWAKQPGRRPEHLVDFRRAVAAAEDARHPGPETHVRRLILQRNLYGMAESRRAYQAATRTLLRYGGRTRPHFACLDLNLGSLPYGSDSGASGPAPKGRQPDAAGPPWEELEVLAWTRNTLRTHRLTEDGPRALLRKAAIELERRRYRLVRDAIVDASVSPAQGSIPDPVRAALLRPPDARPFDTLHIG